MVFPFLNSRLPRLAYAKKSITIDGNKKLNKYRAGSAQAIVGFCPLHAVRAWLNVLLPNPILVCNLPSSNLVWLAAWASQIEHLLPAR